MCGIAGFVNKDGRCADAAKLKAMTDAIAHRGPDAEGQLCAGTIALGHRRLSIIDLSEAGRQPMESMDKRFAIIFNGEIYNYIEIKRELQLLGVNFQNNTDTEVIMEAYRHYGKDCLNKFNGMWAFVIWDREKKQMFISRDRFAIKPLYILERDDIFLFASEAKAILAAEPSENIPDLISVYRFLRQSVLENIDAHSWYQNIKIFPAASYAFYDLESNSYTVERYWSPDYDQFYKKWIDGKDPIITLKELFDSAVGLRLRADVEVGTCLSGGLDSSAIVGCCSKAHGIKMQTFSSRFEDEGCDEREYIDIANKFSNAAAHPIYPDETSAGFIEAFKEIIHYHDGPPAGASLHAQYSVFKEVGKHLKVVLDGQGADELFGGYAGFWNPHLRKLVENGSRIKAMKAVCGIIAEYDQFDIRSLSTDVGVKLLGIEACKALNKTMLKDSGRKNDIYVKYPKYTEIFEKTISDNPCLHNLSKGFPDEISRQCCDQTLLTSLPQLCHNEDSNSMRFSVEVRMPFLDYRLVEFALALDSNYKLKDKWQKWIMRKAFRQYLPVKIRRRRNKMGYPAPFYRWLRESAEKEEFKQIIFALAERNIVPYETIKAYYDAHMSGEVNLEGVLFKFLVLELWLRTCKFDRIGLRKI